MEMTFLIAAAFATAPLDSRRMPEPLIGESVTDIDGTQAGELEIDASGIVARPGGEWNTALEIEWRALSRLGVSVEGTLSGDNTESAAGGLRASLAFLLLHDEEHDFHLMIDATARLFENAVASELGEPTERIAFSLRGGIRRDWLTLRGSLGAGAGTHSAHAVPLRAEAATLVEAAFGFWGIEGAADFARSSPWMVAPEAVLWRGRLQLGAALPWEPGTGRFGALIRLIFETESI
jgi:hypothetical protein